MSMLILHIIILYFMMLLIGLRSHSSVFVNLLFYLVIQYFSLISCLVPILLCCVFLYQFCCGGFSSQPAVDHYVTVKLGELLHSAVLLGA